MISRFLWKVVVVIFLQVHVGVAMSPGSTVATSTMPAMAGAKHNSGLGHCNINSLPRANAREQKKRWII